MRALKRALLICAFLISANGCSHSGISSPSVQPISILHQNENPSVRIGKIDITHFSLSPDETSTLIDGHPYKFEVNLAMTGQIDSETEWEIRAVFNDHSSDPFVLSGIGQGGIFSMSSAIRWEVPVHGEKADIQMNLYRVAHTNSGRKSQKTTFKTLIQSIQRSYNIICDHDEFFFILKMKRFFGYCQD